MPEGLFITFEGGEGAGKSTQIQRLSDLIEQETGRRPILTREPGGTPVGEKIRGLLSGDHDGPQLSGKAELLLIYAARERHLNEVIRPALTSGNTVLCDRFIDSSHVYQKMLQGLSDRLFDVLDDEIIGNTMPDLTFLFDLPAEDALGRVQSRGALDHYDRADSHFYHQLRTGFLKQQETNPDRIIKINAAQSVEAITQDLFSHIKERFADAL